MHKLPVGVLGASGYAGRELCQLVARHPGLELAFATAHAQRGETLALPGRTVRYLAPEDVRFADAALVFSALPHGTSAAWVSRAQQAGARAIDLSADLRPGNCNRQVPYGLTEATRAEVRGAQLVANPGCYPTAVLLALLPLLERGLVRQGATITITAASGVTGAGFTPRPELLFAEVSEDFRAYAVGNEHRHLPEMRAMLTRYGVDADLLFTPHLLPVARGILATITVPLERELARPLAVWQERFRDEPFVEVSESPPALRDVVRRNVARVWAGPAAGLREPALVVIAAIDNLVKGAAGQALQNANLALGLPEAQGLPA